MERNCFVLTALSTLTAGGGGSSRPRVDGDREQEIFDATLAVLRDVGYDRLTMDAVAAHAKASKATLYRKWEDKETLVLTALCEAKGHDEVTDTGSLRGDLLATYCGHGAMADPEFVSLFSSVITAAMRDPHFADAWRREVLEPKLALSRVIWERARSRGEVVNDEVDLELLESAVAGVLMHRLFVLGLPPDEELVTRVIDQIVLPALVAQPASEASTHSQEVTR